LCIVACSGAALPRRPGETPPGAAAGRF